MAGEIRLTEPDPFRRAKENFQEDCLPFFLDDDSSVPDGSPSFSRKKSSIKSTYGFNVNTQLDKIDSASTTSNNINFTSRQRPENNTIRLDSHRTTGRSLTDPLESLEQRPANTCSKGINELIVIFLPPSACGVQN